METITTTATMMTDLTRAITAGQTQDMMMPLDLGMRTVRTPDTTGTTTILTEVSLAFVDWITISSKHSTLIEALSLEMQT